MTKIEKDDLLLAIVHKKNEWKEGLDFLTPNDTFCQVGTWWYQKGKKLKPHKHIENIRDNKLTQECVIVVAGAIAVDVYDSNNQFVCREKLESGDFMVLLNGGHGYDILENNTRVIECKNGPFISVEKDKILF
jgi:hypothetical protein